MKGPDITPKELDLVRRILTYTEFRSGSMPAMGDGHDLLLAYCKLFGIEAPPSLLTPGVFSIAL